MRLSDKIAPKFIGMDLETSGTEPHNKPLPHVPIQIGIATVGHDALGVDVGWEPGTFAVDEESLGINKFTLDRIHDSMPADEASNRVREFLAEKVPQTAKYHVVGWNVGSFDIQFVNAHLPKLAERFHRRSVDLNSVAFTVAAVTGKNPDKLKEMSKRFAADNLASQGHTANWHDAMYDAKAALYSWYWFIEHTGSLEYLAGALNQRIARGEK